MRQEVPSNNYVGASLKQTKWTLSETMKISKDTGKVINLEYLLCNQ